MDMIPPALELPFPGARRSLRRTSLSAPISARHLDDTLMPFDFQIKLVVPRRAAWRIAAGADPRHRPTM